MNDWKVIACAHKYEVSRGGKVRSIKSGRKIKPQLANGYLVYTLYVDGEVQRRDHRSGKVYVYKTKTFKKAMHRLLAEAFIYNDSPETKTQVNHRDGDKLNNKLSNLEWCTPSDNQIHAISLGLVKHRKGEDKTHSKLTEEIVRVIRDLPQYKYSNQSLAKMFNVSTMVLWRARTGKTWKHVN